jgi:hypothetical protein
MFTAPAAAPLTAAPVPPPPPAALAIAVVAVAIAVVLLVLSPLAVLPPALLVLLPLVLLLRLGGRGVVRGSPFARPAAGGALAGSLDRTFGAFGAGFDGRELLPRRRGVAVHARVSSAAALVGRSIGVAVRVGIIGLGGLIAVVGRTGATAATGWTATLVHAAVTVWGKISSCVRDANVA